MTAAPELVPGGGLAGDLDGDGGGAVARSLLRGRGRHGGQLLGVDLGEEIVVVIVKVGGDPRLNKNMD